MSKFCAYDELECLQVHTNLYVFQVFQKAHSARKTLYFEKLPTLPPKLDFFFVSLLRARPKAERVHRQLAEIFHIERPGPTVTRFGGLYLWSRAFDWVAVFFTG